MRDTDPIEAIQKAAEHHLDAVYDAQALQEEADMDLVDHEVPSPASWPFCGCTTCTVREVLHGAWPAIEEYFAEQARKERGAEIW